MTQRELAKRTEISRVTISYYINEHNFPNKENLHRIAEALCVDVSELLGDKVLSIEEENQFLSCFREMRKIYPNETLLLIRPTTYRGYDLATGKKMILKVEEVDWRWQTQKNILEMKIQ